MGRAVLAGLAYFAVVFAFGFGLGSVRVLLVAPALGEFKAVLIELPVMLMACWLIAGWLTRRLHVPDSQAAALLMSGVAFTCLMLAELSFGALAFDRTISDQLLHWLTPAGALGLIGQIAFCTVCMDSGPPSGFQLVANVTNLSGIRFRQSGSASWLASGFTHRALRATPRARPMPTCPKAPMSGR